MRECVFLPTWNRLKTSQYWFKPVSRYHNPHSLEGNKSTYETIPTLVWASIAGHSNVESLDTLVTNRLHVSVQCTDSKCIKTGIG